MNGSTRNFAIMLGTAIAAAALFWLLHDHWGHALGAFPYLLFLVCPLMHLFMHHSHGSHEHHQGGNAPPPAGTP
jgi:hypothetical protein